MTDSWRGVAAEEHDEVPSGVSAILRKRSRKLLGLLLRPHLRRLTLSMALIVAHTAASLTIPYIVGRGIDKGIEPALEGTRDLTTLWLHAVALFVMVVLASLTDRAFLSVSGRLGQDILFDLRRRLFGQFQRLSLSFYERYTSGRIIARLTSDVDAISELLQTGLTSFVWAALSIVGIGVILLNLSPRLGVVTLLSFPLILALTRWFRHHSERSYRAVRTAVALVIVHFTESLRGIRAVQSYRREPRNQEIFQNLDASYRDANIWSGRLAATYGPGINFLGRLTTATVLVYGGFLVSDGSLSFGILASFILYVRQFFEPMQDLSQFYNVFQAATAALEKLAGVMEEEPRVPEPADPVIPEHLGGRITFDQVTFAYLEDPVIHELSVDVPAGQTVALVGETGAGKSTIARLIARFYDPSAGHVLLDGVDLKDIPGDVLHRAVVAVTQESFLFNGSIGDNISFGRPDAAQEEIEAAAGAIGAHEFISSLSDGYATHVKKRGGRLSSGQRQLIAFARAFLAGPAVLILDEATSSLDLPTERLVQRALRTLLADRTAFIIAHRLSTVEIADRVLVIHEGRIVEDGSPSELILEGGAYRDLQSAWIESLA